MPFENCGTTALVRRLLACGEVRALSGLLHLSEQENAWCDKDARYSWFPQCSQLSTPSPVSPRLMTTPVARHPLPQGGEGREFARTGHDHRNYHRPRRFRSLLRKCRNSRAELRSAEAGAPLGPCRDVRARHGLPPQPGSSPARRRSLRNVQIHEARAKRSRDGGQDARGPSGVGAGLVPAHPGPIRPPTGGHPRGVPLRK